MRDDSIRQIRHAWRRVSFRALTALSEPKAQPPEPDDAAQLQEHVNIINANLDEAREVARALRQIRDHQLYRETHEAFEAYALERFGLDECLLAFIDVLADAENELTAADSGH